LALGASFEPTCCGLCHGTRLALKPLLKKVRLEMRWLNNLVFAAGALLVGCSGADDIPSGLCAKQHIEKAFAGCDERSARAPFVPWPAATSDKVIAGLQGAGFIGVNGKTYSYAGDHNGDAESARHATTLYELELDGSKVDDFRPYVTFSE